jgi:hypothetical protein
MALRLKRGTNAQRTGYTPEQGELIYVTDYVTASVGPLWVGDGTTVGGVQISTAGGGGLSQVADDTTPELGGNLSLSGFEINGIGDIDITGTVTATSFVGDGSGLTGISTTPTGPFVGELIGSVFGDDSTLIIDGISSELIINSATINSLAATTASLTQVDDRALLSFIKNTASDISASQDFLGTLFFQRDDANGLATPSLIVGGNGGIYMAHNITGTQTEPDYLSYTSDGLAIGAFAPLAKLDVRGNAIITGGLTADLNGSVFADDSTLLVDAVAGTLNLGTNSLADIGDVSVSSPQTGQVLKWNGSSWANASDAVGGGGTGGSAFTNIGIGADDSAIRSIFEGESVLILGGTGITTASDVEGNITITGFDGAFASLSGIPTTLAGYGISDAATSAQGALADTALQPADVGTFTLTGSTMDTSDSSAITITPAVVMNSDLAVENNLDVTGTVTAERFVSSTTGTPEIESATNLNLTAGNAVIITSSPLRMASFTTAERDLLAAQNGDMIYNTTLNKFQGYENGAWANLI